MSKVSGHQIRPRTLTAIVAAATRLLSTDPRVTMSEIARAAGVGRATLHRHFHCKADLLRFISVRCIDDMNAAVRAADVPDRPAVDRLRAMLESVIPLGDRYAFLRFGVTEDGTLRESYEAQLEWVAALIRQLRDEGAIADDMPTQWAIAQVDQVIWTAWTAVSTGEVTSADAAKLALRTLLKGLR